MEPFHIDIFFYGLTTSADVHYESNPYHIKYTVKFVSQIIILTNVRWMEITFEKPVTYFDSKIIAPRPEVSFSNPLFEDHEFVDVILESIAKKNGFLE